MITEAMYITTQRKLTSKTSHRPGRPGYLAATARTAGLSRAVMCPLSRTSVSPTRQVAVRVSPVQ
jgi:hypothetical protein